MSLNIKKESSQSVSWLQRLPTDYKSGDFLGNGKKSWHFKLIRLPTLSFNIKKELIQSVSDFKLGVG